MCKDGKSNPMAKTYNVEPRKALPKWDISPPTVRELPGMGND